MRLKIITAGKPALGFIKSGIDEYLKRLKRYNNIEWIVVKSGSAEDVSKRLLEQSIGCYRIALDETGATWTTMQFYQHIQDLENRGDVKYVALLIGAADGHTEDLRKQSNQIMSLSAMTLQHEIAALILMEQLYRIATIKAGSPYHREGEVEQRMS